MLSHNDTKCAAPNIQSWDTIPRNLSQGRVGKNEMAKKYNANRDEHEDTRRDDIIKKQQIKLLLKSEILDL